MKPKKENKEFADFDIFQLERLTVSLDRKMEHCDHINSSQINLWI